MDIARYARPAAVVAAIVAAFLVLQFGIDLDELAETAGKIVTVVLGVYALTRGVTPVNSPRDNDGYDLVPITELYDHDSSDI